jgi:putative spermidine/putrescine transport system permease protein
MADAPPASRRRAWQLAACLPAVALVGFVLVLPVGWLFWLSVHDHAGFTARNYLRMVVNSSYSASLQTTLWVAALVTLCAVLLAYPVALFLARLRGWQARLVLIVVLLPLWTSLLVRTFAWLVLLQRHGLVNSTLVRLGVIDAPLALVNNLTGTVIGMTHVMVPFVVLPVCAALRAIDPQLPRAARSLGANGARVFRDVVLPLSLHGVLSGATLVFVMSLGFYVMPAFLGGGGLQMWSNRIQTNIDVYPDWGAASALGVVLLVLTVIVLAASRRLMRVALAAA